MVYSTDAEHAKQSQGYMIPGIDWELVNELNSYRKEVLDSPRARDCLMSRGVCSVRKELRSLRQEMPVGADLYHISMKVLH